MAYIHDGRPRLVACLEWIEGPTFEEFIVGLSGLNAHQRNSLLNNLIRQVLGPLANNIGRLHQRHIGHGDLHGRNIKVRVRGDAGRRSFECVIYDFVGAAPGREDELIAADVKWLNQRMDECLSRVTRGPDLLRVIANAQTASGIAFTLQTFAAVFLDCDQGAFRRSRAIWAYHLAACRRYEQYEPEMARHLIALLRELADDSGELKVYEDAEHCLGDPAYDYREDDAPALPIEDIEQSLQDERSTQTRAQEASEALIALLPHR